MTLNRATLSAVKAGWITTLSMMRVAAPTPSSRRVEMRISKFSLICAPGKPGERSHPTETPRDQLLVARGMEQVRPSPKLFRLQLQGRRVDAVAQAGRAGAVIEDVAEMAVAFRAQYL